MLKFIKEHNDKALLFLILFIGAVLRIYNFWGLSLSNDEFSALSRAQLTGFSEFITKGINADIHPAGVEVFIYLWIKIFGTSVFMLRLPFIFCSVLTIYFSYRVSERWFNNYTGLFVAAAIGFLEFPLMHGQLARPFTPALLFSLLTIFYWTRILFDNKTDRRTIIALSFSAVMAAYCHYFALIFILIVLLTGIFYLKKSSVKAYFTSIIIAFVIYIPNIFVFIQQMANPAGINWLTEPDGNWFFEHIFFLFNNSYILLYAVLAFFILTHILSYTEINFSKFHLISVAWFIIPYLAAFYYSVWVKPILENSILLFSFPMLLFFLFSFVQPGKKILNYSALFILLGIGIYSTIGERKYYTTYNFGEFKDVANKIVSWNDEIGNAKITNIINVNSPYYINYYLQKESREINFAMTRNEGMLDLHTLNKIIQNSKTPYLLYAWSSVVDPNETEDMIRAKYPYIIKQINYNNMAAVTLYSMNDSAKAIAQPKPVYYVFNGFEDKQTWDKDTSIITKEKVWKGIYAAKLDSRDEYGPACANRISKLTDLPFKSVHVSLWAYATGSFKDAQVVATMNFKDDENQVYENYFWLSSKFSYFIDKNKWGQVFFSFNLPELRSRNDELKIYVWNPDKQPLYIDNFEMKLYEK
jgi:hypothetical protein